METLHSKLFLVEMRRSRKLVAGSIPTVFAHAVATQTFCLKLSDKSTQVSFGPPKVTII